MPRHEEGAPRRHPLANVALILATIAWAVLFLAVLAGGAFFVFGLVSARSAPQEAALGAVVSTAFIGAYVAVRCVEKLAGSVGRFLSGR